MHCISKVSCMHVRFILLISTIAYKLSSCLRLIKFKIHNFLMGPSGLPIECLYIANRSWKQFQERHILLLHFGFRTYYTRSENISERKSRDILIDIHLVCNMYDCAVSIYVELQEWVETPIHIPIPWYTYYIPQIDNNNLAFEIHASFQITNRLNIVDSLCCICYVQCALCKSYETRYFKNILYVVVDGKHHVSDMSHSGRNSNM